MKIIFILAFVFFNLSFAHHVKDEKSLSITYAEFWPPYSYKDTNGKMHGILVRILDEILDKKLQINLTHIGFPWKRAQVLVEQGVYDAVITYPSKDRLKYLSSTNELFINLQWRGFYNKYTNKAKKIIESKNPLTIKDLIFCSVLGDGTGFKIYDKYGIKSFKNKNTITAVNSLRTNQCDFFINSKLAMLSSINELGLNKNLKIHKKVFNEVPFTFLLSNKSHFDKSLLKDIDKLLYVMKRTGEYQMILEKIITEELEKYKNFKRKKYVK